MMDFNIGKTEDPLLTASIDLFKQEIEVLFYTDPNEVLAGGDNWLDIGRLVFDKSVSEEALKSKIDDLIRSECFFESEFEWNVNVRFVEGEIDDIGVIDVAIKSQDQTRNATFVIT